MKIPHTWTHRFLEGKFKLGVGALEFEFIRGTLLLYSWELGGEWMMNLISNEEKYFLYQLWGHLEFKGLIYPRKNKNNKEFMSSSPLAWHGQIAEHHWYGIPISGHPTGMTRPCYVKLLVFALGSCLAYVAWSYCGPLLFWGCILPLNSF